MALHTTTHSLNVFYKNLLLVNPSTTTTTKSTSPQKKSLQVIKAQTIPDIVGSLVSFF